MGTPEAAIPSLRRLVEDGHEILSVWTQPDRVSGRGQERQTQPPVKTFALSRGLKVEQPEKIKIAAAKELFASYKADVAVVVAYGRILPLEYLTAPLSGCINVHFSLLPRYRGAAPVNWAIVEGEERTGVTTMFVEEKLDSGPILLQSETTIGATETAPELMERLADIGADLLSDTIRQLPEITPRGQDDNQATLAPMLTKASGVIDWSTDAAKIERCTRGLQPWPNAYTSYNGRRLIIWRAQVVNDAAGLAQAGEIVAAHGEDVVVSCGSGTRLRLLEVQPESSRRMSARDFLNGTRVTIGDRLGEV